MHDVQREIAYNGNERQEMKETRACAVPHVAYEVCEPVENANLLANRAAIRWFLPQETDLRKVTAAYIQRIKDWMNPYPREVRGFQTAETLFQINLAAVAQCFKRSPGSIYKKVLVFSAFTLEFCRSIDRDNNPFHNA